ncbi:NADH dehydrogenase (ubiquinone) Fe-S protein 6 [Sporothrix brasiliensis 5110]|uniref:NADH dehydrogenase (Ubiquinone) Fe-S protein 6 n=1 Tax=Sporothrix brasiliensis 5110 TaxID=1398154 RepID=A0A0C2IUZ7_9PEZI|nr:NADH dehydrogenase (ubiquinone) Fe-S protein 6 [Sporothrix brasiliensis 5110]KIH92981.1 NADH dehydrogenase (ubiquinone) Fe-S protein 6 [Sporothrix brasiliensis 5110]
MMSLRAGSRLLPQRLARGGRVGHRSFAMTTRMGQDSTAAPVQTDLTPQSTTEAGAPTTTELQQAPNRSGVWTRNQQPREKAMTGPRFEQTDFSLQPQPYSAMELVHQEPVRWTHDRIVACDGGGGAAGHPRVFINTDKPQISVCGYCGLPFANEHHRKHLESLPQTSYPL